MYKFCLFLLLIYSLSLYSQEKGRMEALLVFDTNTDLHDALLNNKQLLLTSLAKIAQAANLHLKVHVLEAEDVTIYNLRKWFCDLQEGTHDVVFFYFSGHGRATRDSSWPSLYVQSDRDMISMKNILTMMNHVRSRLTLTFSDCCNSSHQRPLSDIVKLIPGWSSKFEACFQKSQRLCKQMSSSLDQRKLKHLLPGASRLFLKQKGHIAAVGASPGQMAIAFPKSGGVFTLSLINSLVTVSAQKQASWQEVMSSVDELCRPIQAPYKSISK